MFYGTDANENRAHVHVAKRGMEHACKIWLEPNIVVADGGDLTIAQIKQVVEITTEHKDKLMKQWKNFKEGKTIKILTIKK